MSPEKGKELEHRIFSEVEACLKNRGLIIMRNGYEHYDDGTEALRDSMVEEIMESYRREKAGEKKPFFIGKLGLQGAIAVACWNRGNGLQKEFILRRIDMNSATDEYTVSVLGDAIERSEFQMDVARPENVSSRFGEPINLCNQSSQLALEESELFSAFKAALDRISEVGKNGKLYCRTIQFYLEEFDEEMSKKDEISALTEFLGVSRSRAKIAKHWALKFLKRELSPFIDFDRYENLMQRKREIAGRFKKISNDDLLESYDRRYNLFLDPHLGQRIACNTRILSIKDGKKDKKSGGVELTVSKENKATVIDDVA